ncbi:aspartate--tRNA(Asn) ligase [Methanosphaera sp. Vir-13MRS]|uniref:aspartate--tRNA(Asn) ligase n=1 Tax=Candidatus Methanosphaera massiliense TaxID=3017187 RepID=UPI002380606B|nr:aspartate--tRNA(Asn) ligase [Candidatus Methanosphaera massiliense]MDD6285772.1 aspartate--tRNA(Asn) ligase [Methanobacteriaceae archaeon]MDE4078088.1 aspartate--tRNA(Asn) ligase [Candidatus Methanosphaera massiliense]MDY2744509.1 aspartate--tRNA(Asn) ligase [Methanosphaera sp.]
MTDIFDKCKRTHYSNQISPENEGETVKVTGWVHEIRDLGGIVFLLLRDKNGITQITAPSKKVSAEMMEDIRAARKETIITVTGTVQKSPKAPNGIEIIPSNIDIINVAQLPLPLDTTEKVDAELDTRLDSRFIDIRKHDVSAIFKIKSQMLHTARNYFYDHDFTEITTPKLVASATEGGTELFPITYFEKEAFLGQSPQLYKQMMMATGLDNVFEIGQIFRAEEHDTLRHLNEALSIDAEMSFRSQEDAMNTLESLIKTILANIQENCAKELEDLGHELDIPTEPFPVVSYDKVLDIVNSHDVEMNYGDDLSRAAEKVLGEEMGSYYFITEWPMSIKPFYVMPSTKDPEISTSFDLMYRDLELSSGSQRIHDYDLLYSRLEAKDLNPDSFEKYLEAFKYGMPPHSGWGMGADRLTMVLTGSKNIRETVLFPRDRRRLTP